MLSQAASRVHRRTVLLLGVLAAIGLAIPTLKWSGHSPFGNVAGQGTAVPGDSGATGSGLVAAAGDDPARDRSVAGNAKSDDVPEYLPRPTKEEENILATLGKRIDIDFNEVPLEECIKLLGEKTELPFWLDRPTLADEGVALDQPIRMNLKATRVEAVLRLMLKPLQLEFVPENDVVLITTSAKAGENLSTRTYPVRDLVAAPEKPEREETTAKKEGSDATPSPPRRGGPFNSLMQAIESAVEPDTWECLSGPGSMSPVPQTGSLVIRQTWRIHRQILQLLRDLREAKRSGPPAPANAPGGV
jgi:hypothetical protein